MKPMEWCPKERTMSMIWFKHYCCSGECYLFILCRSSTEGEHNTVLTSRNEAYRVVSIREKHGIGVGDGPAGPAVVGPTFRQ